MDASNSELARGELAEAGAHAGIDVGPVLSKSAEEGLSFVVNLHMEDDEALFTQLVEYATRYNITTPTIEVLFTLPSAFPAEPPVLRVLRPILRPGTGNVIAGFPLLPELMPEGWSPELPLLIVCGLLKQLLVNGSAAVELETRAVYPLQAFAAARRRCLARADPRLALPSPANFSRSYFVYSSAFASTVMGLRIPDGFEAGNKVLLPSCTLELMARSELSADSGAGTGARRTGRNRSAAAPGAFSEESAAMLFQLVPPLLFPSFVGVAEFSVPHAGASFLWLRVCLVVHARSLDWVLRACAYSSLVEVLRACA